MGRESDIRCQNGMVWAKAKAKIGTAEFCGGQDVIGICEALRHNGAG